MLPRYPCTVLLIITLLVVCEPVVAGKMMDKIKDKFKKKACKQKIVAITIPKYKYVDVPLAKEIPTIKFGKVKKMKVGKYKKYDKSSDFSWD